MLNYAIIQREVYEWSLHNFGDQSPENPLMGLIEETGELAHAYLKARQAIRQAENLNTKALMEDAIGDIFIYLCDFTARLQMPTNLFHPKTQFNPDYGSVVRIAVEVGMLCLNYRTYSGSVDSLLVQDLLTELARFCATNDIDFDQAVTKTWDTVKQRDWVLYPKNGKTE